MSPHRVPRAWSLAAVLSILLVLAPGARLGAYPLDGRATSGIRRLDGYLKAQAAETRSPKLPPGALLPTAEVTLKLAGKNETWDLASVKKDQALQASLDSIFASRDPSYAVAVIDITDPDAIAWAGVREDQKYYPGSVGKVLCMVALFDGLKRAFPDLAERARVLKDTGVVAGEWIRSDSHTVPHYDEASGTNRFALFSVGERFTLAEWVDHMVSPSSNSAGAMVWKEALLLRHFGKDYPPSPDEEKAFFDKTPKAELHALSLEVIEAPLKEAGIDVASIRQGTMWTWYGKSRIPGTASFASPRELARLLLRIEQGRMVDAWSSLEMKRFLYMTKKRYRYAYAPELKDSAVYFKSGSLYKCAPEDGFKCGKYRGNVENLMNSIAIVESPARPPEAAAGAPGEAGRGQRRYIVALMSNVLRKNSAWDHSRLAAAIEEAIRTRQPVKVDEAGSSQEISDAGKAEAVDTSKGD